MSARAPARHLLTVRETAERLRVSEKTVRRLICAEILPALRIGGSIRVDPDELQAWLYGAVSDDGSRQGSCAPAQNTHPTERCETQDRGKSRSLPVKRIACP
jgi:excisionase family DNA binding protein